MAVPLFRHQVAQAALVQEALSAAVQSIRRLTALESADGQLVKGAGADELPCQETTDLLYHPYFPGESAGQ